MPILDAHGEVIESEAQTELTLAPGGSVKLHFTAAGGRIKVDDDAAIHVPEGEWILMPLPIWSRTLARALAAEEQRTRPRKGRRN